MLGWQRAVGVPRGIGCAPAAVSTPRRSACGRCRLVPTKRHATTFGVASSRSRRRTGPTPRRQRVRQGQRRTVDRAWAGGSGRVSSQSAFWARTVSDLRLSAPRWRDENLRAQMNARTDSALGVAASPSRHARSMRPAMRTNRRSAPRTRAHRRSVRITRTSGIRGYHYRGRIAVGHTHLNRRSLVPPTMRSASSHAHFQCSSQASGQADAPTGDVPTTYQAIGKQR